MNPLKLIVKKLLPRRIISLIRNNFHILELNKTRKIFKEAKPSPSFLEPDVLDTLQSKYKYPPEYGYDKKSLENRGIIRTKEIFHLSGAKESHSFLELGCWDGMVSCVLKRKGKEVTAIDRTTEGFEKTALEEGVKFFQMGAEELQFEDESFDFVFSYDSFEHFEKPEKVLSEAIRVVKKGGYIFLSFGPLYYSPFGEHAYRSITVPYCQILFKGNTLNQYTEQKKLTPIDFNHVNRWSLEMYNDLWGKHRNSLHRISYNKSYNLEHLDLIRKYSSCFKSKSDNFDNFIVATLEILFQKM